MCCHRICKGLLLLSYKTEIMVLKNDTLFIGKVALYICQPFPPGDITIKPGENARLKYLMFLKSVSR